MISPFTDSPEEIRLAPGPRTQLFGGGAGPTQKSVGDSTRRALGWEQKSLEFSIIRVFSKTPGRCGVMFLNAPRPPPLVCGPGETESSLCGPPVWSFSLISLSVMGPSQGWQPHEPPCALTHD